MLIRIIFLLKPLDLVALNKQFQTITESVSASLQVILLAAVMLLGAQLLLGQKQSLPCMFLLFLASCRLSHR